MDEEENSVVYYWEINWPRFFSNRDYCCHRSVQVCSNHRKRKIFSDQHKTKQLNPLQVDPETGTVACISTSTDHPGCKGSRGVVRVSIMQLQLDKYKRLLQVGNYRSALTVRPHTAPELPGTEFCLTGFEDPGVQLPETIITWVFIYSLTISLSLVLFSSVPFLGSSQRDAWVHAGTESSLPEATKRKGE